MYNPTPFKITDVRKLTEDIRVLRVKTRINPAPGQFFEVSILGMGECPLASCSYNKDYVDILIRNVGRVTSSIFKLKKGDDILIRGPYGNGFPLEKMKKKNLIMIAGGTGIAPVTSAIDYVEQNRKDFGEVEIYFGFKNKEYILLKDRIKEWKKKFKVVLCLDNPEKEWKGEKGFLCDALPKYLKKPNIKNAIALLCGPEVMMETATKNLNSLGLENNKIYWSLERRMECAMGNCGRCLIQDVYVCKDGPIFKYDEIKRKIENEEKSNEEER